MIKSMFVFLIMAVFMSQSAHAFYNCNCVNGSPEYYELLDDGNCYRVYCVGSSGKNQCIRDLHSPYNGLEKSVIVDRSFCVLCGEDGVCEPNPDPTTQNLK